MEREKLLEDLKEEFAKLKKEFGFKSSFEEIERIFFIKDIVLREGYVSPRLNRTIAHRIVDTYNSWVWYLHGLFVPNPSSMFNITESQYFSEEEKKGFTDLMNKVLELASRNSVNSLTQDKAEEAKFIDDAVNFWNREFNPKLREITKIVNAKWKAKIK